jgi:hypothetical protein
MPLIEDEPRRSSMSGGRRRTATNATISWAYAVICSFEDSHVVLTE